MSPLRQHKITAEAIAAQLKALNGTDPVKFIRGGISHKVPNAGPENNTYSKNKAGNNQSLPRTREIHLPPLNNILEIDPASQTATAESGVAFTDLVKATLKYNLVPYTVPELKTITVGGAVSGCSVESMSYKYGGFHDSCLEYEIITAKGQILTCSPQNNTGIFHMMHGTFGTIGIITKIKFRLHPAKPFVKLDYLRYKTFPEYKAAIREHYEKKDADLMDGIIHSPDNFTLCIGTFTDNAPYTNTYDHQKQPLHQKIPYHKSTLLRQEDYMETHDYFFRYDADCHWISRNYGLENPLLRTLFGGSFLSSTKMIKASKKLNFIFKHTRPEVIVDVFVPFSRFEDFYGFYEKEFNYYPLWIVPYKIADRYPWINRDFMKDVKDELFIDCAVYGLRQPSGKDYYTMLDQKLLELKGIKTLISHNSYTPETFWQIYDRQNYSRVKELTDPQNIFRDMYRKTH